MWRRSLKFLAFKVKHFVMKVEDYPWTRNRGPTKCSVLGLNMLLLLYCRQTMRDSLKDGKDPMLMLRGPICGEMDELSSGENKNRNGYLA